MAETLPAPALGTCYTGNENSQWHRTTNNSVSFGDGTSNFAKRVMSMDNTVYKSNAHVRPISLKTMYYIKF